MAEASPYVMSGNGRIHTGWCRVGGRPSGHAPRPVTLDEIVAWVKGHHPNGIGRYSVCSARCCGAAPAFWLKEHRPELCPQERDSA